MIRREWLLGVGLLSGGIGVGLGGMTAGPALAQSGSDIGTVAAVKPDAFGAPPSAPEQTLAIGAGLVENEKIRTTADGTANVVFADRTTLTVGKNSEITLDKFVYDPASGTGSMALNLKQGALRFVGGALSKGGGNEVQVKTPTATMTVRGAIALFFTQPDGSSVAILVYGNSLTDTASGKELHRPGFMFKFPADGGPPVIEKVTDGELAGLLQQFGNQTGLGGKLPDEELALLEQQLNDGRIGELITELRDQIDQQQPSNPALDALRQSLSQTTAPDNTNPYR